MGVDLPSQSERKKAKTAPDYTVQVRLAVEGEDDLLEYVALEPAEEEPVHEGELIEDEKPTQDKALDFEVNEDPTAGESKRLIALNPKTEEDDFLPGSREEKEFQEGELGMLRLIVWQNVSGVIMKNRHKFIKSNGAADESQTFHKKDLLAVVNVSRKMKGWAAEAEGDTKNESEPGPMVSIKAETIEQIKNLRDGFYLILKMYQGKIFVFGKQRAADMDLDTLESSFKAIDNTPDFFNKNDEIENGEWKGDAQIVKRF